jgi:hypothetical protein
MPSCSAAHDSGLTSSGSEMLMSSSPCSDQGVEVDRAPLLELDDLHIRQTEPPCRLPGAHAQQRSEGPEGVDGGAAPELGDSGVVQHRSLVVVAAGTEGLAEDRVGLLVVISTDQGSAVGTALAGWVAAAVGSPPVDGPKAGSGEGEEYGRMLRHGLGVTAAM